MELEGVVLETVLKLLEVLTTLKDILKKEEDIDSLLKRRWKLVEGPFPNLSIELGEASVPKELDYPLTLVYGSDESKRVELFIRSTFNIVRIYSNDPSISTILVIENGEVSFFNLLKLATVIKMNPGLSDRILEKVKLEYNKVSEAFEKLKQSLTVLELTLR